MKETDTDELTRRYTRAVTAVQDLKRIRDYITAPGIKMPGLAAKIRSAIKSAEGAANNAWRFAQKTEESFTERELRERIERQSALPGSQKRRRYELPGGRRSLANLAAQTVGRVKKWEGHSEK
jgi:hypothetical protein